MSRDAKIKILITFIGCFLSIYILGKFVALSINKPVGIAITLNYILLLFSIFWCSRRK